MSKDEPRIHDPRRYWLDQPGAPKPKLDNEKPEGKTVRYEELLKTWEEARES